MNSQMTAGQKQMNEGAVYISTVTKGNAALFTEGLRCLGTKRNAIRPMCMHLLAKFNGNHQIAGVFRCSKAGCKQDVEVSLRSTPSVGVTQ